MCVHRDECVRDMGVYVVLCNLKKQCATRYTCHEVKIVECTKIAQVDSLLFVVFRFFSGYIFCK